MKKHLTHPSMTWGLVALLLTAAGVALYGPTPGEAQRSLRQSSLALTSVLSTAATASFQTLAADLTISVAGYGASATGATSYVGPVMGNVISTLNLTATKNILFGVLGKYDHTGTSSST